MLKRDDIRIRDPFILTDREHKKYYMYGTTALNADLSTRPSFSVYESEDLENFKEPIEVFNGERFWADRDFWAPEVYKYLGRYYMFASFKSAGHVRAVQILVSDTPTGRFAPVSEKPVTPKGWECLDGTFFVDRGKPYMIFSREWLQVGDGEFYSVLLSEDLSEVRSAPKLMFKASAHPYLKPFAANGFDKCYVTDGPFLYREHDRVKMIWSGLSEGKNYCVLLSEAETVEGEWKHNPIPLFDKNGGHAMIFENLKGDKYISLHRPNNPQSERAVFLKYSELMLKEENK